MVSLEEFILMDYYSEDEVEDEPRQRERGGGFRETEFKFKKNYRLTKALATELIEEVTPLIKQGYRSSDLSVETKVLIALNFFATGSYQNSVANHKNACVVQSTVSQSVSEVVAALNNPIIFNKWVKYPATFEELNINARKFYELYGMPGVVGCIDCTHVAIHPPFLEHYDERSYVNRKGYHSINTQLICDADLKILNVNALYPGSTHDSFIWNHSNVYPLMRQINQNGKYYLIGDSGYAFRPWLHTPIAEPVTAKEQSYNAVFKTARATIERCNGVLKGRFRCLLKHRVLHYLPEKAIKIINSCCVLHNMCIKYNVQLEGTEDEDDLNDDADFGLYTPENRPPQTEPTALGARRRNPDLVAAELIRRRIVQNYF